MPIIGGLLPMTTIDYPDHLAAVLFCQGCGWRCQYCHNPELLPTKGENQLNWADVLAFLNKRKGLLDAVVFSGGEPCLQAALLAGIKAVKALGFKVGLHSSGCYPERLKAILPWVDWIGLDVKALPENYPRLTGKARSGLDAWHSVELVLASKVKHQMRITLHPDFTSQSEATKIQERLNKMGAQELVLQQARV